MYRDTRKKMRSSHRHIYHAPRPQRRAQYFFVDDGLCTPTPGIAATTAAAVTAFSGRADDAFSSILRPSQFGPGCRSYAAWDGIRPLDGLGGSRAAPGGPGPAS